MATPADHDLTVVLQWAAEITRAEAELELHQAEAQVREVLDCSRQVMQYPIDPGSRPVLVYLIRPGEGRPRIPGPTEA